MRNSPLLIESFLPHNQHLIRNLQTLHLNYLFQHNIHPDLTDQVKPDWLSSPIATNSLSREVQISVF